MNPTHHMLAAALLITLATAPLIVGCGEPRKNVLLITLDTTRADQLGCYGGRSDVAPNVDQLAATGVRFAHAYSSCPLTAPAHSTILTGLYPYQHGVRDNGLFRLAPEAVTLAEVLNSAGYDTAAFISSFVLEAQFGLNQGFDRYDGLPAEGTKNATGTLDERHGAETTAKFLEWLATAKRPFFAWVHYFDAHFPYEPVEPFKSRFPERAYEGEIATADAEVGRVLKALSDAHLRDDTYVLITADHGEGLGEHGEMTHGYFLYNATTWVPLVLQGPQLPAGMVIDATVSHADITPTILELLQVGDGVPRAGTSLAALWQGGTREEPAYMETELPRLNWGFNPMRGLAQAGWKYLSGGEQELYAPDDRGETSNVLVAQKDRAASMAKRLGEQRANGAINQTTVQLNAREQESLKALGYVAGSADQKVARAAYRRDELIEVIGLRDSGKSHMLTGKLDDAEKEFRRLIEMCPLTYSGYELLGTVLATKAQALKADDPARMELFKQAKPALEKAIELQSGLRDSLFNLAVVLHFLGDDTRAMQVLEEVLKIDPNHAQAKKLLKRP